MLFSEKIRELTRNRTLAQLAREAKLGDHLKNWRNGRADKFGPDHWEPIIRLADACDLNAEQTTELLGAAQKSSFDELQYCEPNEVLRIDNKATQAAIRSIQSRAHSPDHLFGAEQSPITVNTVDFTPAEELSNDALTRALEIAKKSNRRLVLGYALIAVGVAFAITMFVSPVAREAAVRTAASIMERLRENSQPDRPSEPTPDIEILPTRVPTSTTVSQETPTEAASSTSAPEVAPTAIITVTKSQTTTPPSTATKTSIPTVRPTETITPTPLPVSAYPCDAMIIATSVDTVPLFQTASSTSRDTIAVGEAVQLLGTTTSSRVKIQFNGVEYWVNDDNVSPSTCPN